MKKYSEFFITIFSIFISFILSIFFIVNFIIAAHYSIQLSKGDCITDNEKVINLNISNKIHDCTLKEIDSTVNSIKYSWLCNDGIIYKNEYSK